MNGHLISVIIPVWNGERHLGQAIESVLTQTYSSLELIVADDGSTDGSADVARGFGMRLQLVSQPHRGLAAARNAGVRRSRGVFIAHHDADDLMQPDSLALRLAAFEAEPDADIVSGHIMQFHSPETNEEFRRRFPCPAGPMPSYQATAMLIRRDSFMRVGWYDTHWPVGSDMEWFTRARDLGLRLVMIPEVVFRRRIHGGNQGITNREQGNQRLHILKAALDRRRAGKSPPSGPTTR